MDWFRRLFRSRGSYPVPTDDAFPSSASPNDDPRINPVYLNIGAVEHLANGQEDDEVDINGVHAELVQMRELSKSTTSSRKESTSDEPRSSTKVLAEPPSPSKVPFVARSPTKTQTELPSPTKVPFVPRSPSKSHAQPQKAPSEASIKSWPGPVGSQPLAKTESSYRQASLRSYPERSRPLQALFGKLHRLQDAEDTCDSQDSDFYPDSQEGAFDSDGERGSTTAALVGTLHGKTSLSSLKRAQKRLTKGSSRKRRDAAAVGGFEGPFDADFWRRVSWPSLKQTKRCFVYKHKSKWWVTLIERCCSMPLVSWLGIIYASPNAMKNTFLTQICTGALEGILHWYGKMKGGGSGVLPRKILKFKVAKTPKF